MSVYYSPEEIDRLMESVPFEKVLQHYQYPVIGTAKNRGSDCPKCHKNYEHFKINTHRNLANCFVCKWSGNPIHFIQEVEKVDFIPAVEKYAQIGGIQLKSETNQDNKRKQEILQQTVLFYSQFQSDYLSNRGISEEIQKESKVGFAKGGVHLKKHLNNLSFSDEEIEEIGLIKKRSNNKVMDYFFNCVIIPIFKNGKVIDLYGRHVKEGKTKHIYLFGNHFFYNIDQCTSKKSVILVESIINALTLKSNGILNVAAVGSCERFTSKHVTELKSLGFSAAFIGFDTGDRSKSGQKGAIKASELLSKGNIINRILEMPKDIDINDLYTSFTSGHEQMKRIIVNAQERNKFQAKLLLDEIDTKWIQQYMDNRLKETEE